MHPHPGASRRSGLFVFAGLLVLVGPGLRQPAHATRPRLETGTLRSLPIAFEPNVGQSSHTPTARYLARGTGYEAAFTPTEATLRLGEAAAPLRMRLLGADPHARMTAEVPLPGKVHYLRENDRKRWRRNVPTFGRIRARQVYPGIDLVYYGTPDKLEHDFIVAPGADPQRIRVEYSGAEPVRLAEDGRLILTVAGRDVVQHPPVAYQQIGGQRVTIPVRYRLTPTLPLSHSPTRIAFDLAGFDRSKPLVIDPVLDWSQRIPDSPGPVPVASDFRPSGSMARDASGNLYLLGETWRPGGSESLIVVRKFSADGSVLSTTHFGGTGRNIAGTLTADPRGSVIVTGHPGPDFPLVNPYQSTPGGPFIARLTPDGSDLAYSTYFSGGFIAGVAPAANGELCVVGMAGSGLPGALPLVNAIQPQPGGGTEAFAARFSADGSHLIYSTYLGGNENDQAVAVDVDGEGNAYLTGTTSSVDFPVKNPLQRKIGSFVRDGPDAFVTKLSSEGELLYSTFLGGEAGDSPSAIAVDAHGYACVVGSTASADFPVVRALQRRIFPNDPRRFPPGDIFISRLVPDGSRFVFSTYLGGASSSDLCSSVKLDAAGNIYLAGLAGDMPDGADAGFPLLHSLQPFAGGGDAFVAKLPADGSRLLYSTVLGSVQYDIAVALALDADEGLYVLGLTAGDTDYPFPFTRPDEGYGPAFLARLTTNSGRLLLRPRSLDFGTLAVGETKRLRLTLKNAGARPLGVTAASRAYAVSVEPSSRLTLQPGESVVLGVTYSAVAPGRLRGLPGWKPSLVLLTTDQSDATVLVPLSGRAKPAPAPE
jgi:hypothetical protein